MWLSTEIMNWNATQEDATGFGDDSSKRAYDLWNHAQRVLHEHNEALYLVDVITTLKRSINHRLQHLNSFYRLEKIPTKEKSPGLLQQLAVLGIIKPIMLKKLMAIRNDIEHQDAQPPPKVV